MITNLKEVQNYRKRIQITCTNNFENEVKKREKFGKINEGPLALFSSDAGKKREKFGKINEGSLALFNSDCW